LGPLIPGDVRELLEGRNFGHVATALPDGSPHSVPVWIGVEGDHVVFFTQSGSRKARNLERDPRVAISLVDLENPYRSAQLRGRVAGTVEGDEALQIIDRLSVKYTGEPFPMRSGVVFLVEPERARYTELPFRYTPS
jgi:PPOX class probable F420-dependent enzyme